MDRRLNEIEDLADSIGSAYLNKGKVNLNRIIADNNIRLIYSKYKDDFLGQLVHELDNFYIHINLKDMKKTSGKARVTTAHELGHYFIPEHRTQLQNGLSLSYNKDNTCNPDIPKEKEAERFASFLLMPKAEFSKICSFYNPGLESIIRLRDQFSTSIESSTIRYIRESAAPCMCIKLNADFTYNYSFYNKRLSNIIKFKDKPSIRIDKSYLTDVICNLNALPKFSYIENATQISKWVASVSPGSKFDLVGLEQIVKLGRYGAMVFLMFS